MGKRIACIVKASALAAAYFCGYKFAWQHSADQFFLPAGLRMASLIFLPYRMWPSIFFGDAAAMLSLRLPIAEAEGVSIIWAYSSSLLLCPLASIVPFAARRFYSIAIQKVQLFPIILIFCALWGVISNTSLNSIFGYPLPEQTIRYIYRFGIGQYLAIMIFVLPCLLWKRRTEEYGETAQFIKHSIIAAGSLLCTYFAAGISTETWLRILLLGCMLAPVLAMTARHGWRGAAIGISFANLALGFSMPTTGIFGNKDTDVFIAQQTLAIISTFILITGSMISAASEKSKCTIRAALKESRALVRSQDIQIEQALRDRAEAIALAQSEINSLYRDTVRKLKSSGHYELAMSVNAQSLTNTKMLCAQVSALYPFKIEVHGLYSALHDSEFSEYLNGSTIELRLDGSTANLSATLQLVTYRSICRAIDILPAERYRVHVRTWSLHSERGISVRVQAIPAVKSVGSAKSKLAETQLRSKMHAYGGSSKRRRNGVFFMLGDGDHFLSRGTTIQDELFVPLSSLIVKSSEL
ncbi:MASE1 domain-containing protein [Xanthomonas albilineans]|uniref:MASE1 domain-containing protein n=1 Tax=Xanthomonas albilineans (strain GPE PC73 / CFBP 7063) TaxID=380358 RepID=D2U932_XANAP|nr:MASE1 domain-containing protein [Xanthomonas albilineans]CBA14735.1 conserved hypothetical protein [Xanthomonas albilineans GPE PC73]